MQNSDDEFNNLIESVDVLVSVNGRFKSEWVRDNLKWIHSISAGVEKILLVVRDREVLLSNSKGLHSIQITEQVLGLMLMYERRLDIALKGKLQKSWVGKEILVKNPGELYGKSVLIVGLGNIGKRMVEVFKCLGMDVFAVKSNVSDSDNDVCRVYSASELNDVLHLADYVVITVPLTKQTYHMFGREQFSLMKDSAFILNIGRGSVIDEKTLVTALKEKEIGGAGLDVFESEPLSEDSELWNLDNVLITPHTAGLTPKYMDRAADIFFKNLECFVNNKELPTSVDKEKGY